MDLSKEMWMGIPSLVKHHWKEGNYNWFMVIYISICHIMAGIGAVKYLPLASANTLMMCYFLYYFSGLGIIVGLHRLWAHRTYEASLPLRIFLMLGASAANEGSIFHWVRDHRVHHKYSETHGDPHNATRGFFFAHCGWLLIKKHPDVIKHGRDIDMSDILADKVVMFQKKLDPWINVYMCFFFPAQIASHFWKEDFWTAFFVAGFLRYVIVLHFTWMVNSAAHLYGDHPYDTLSYPAENPLVAWVTGGEGWHNWHHKYPYDYATSEFGGLAQYNPGKAAIDVFCALGLASNPKRATAAWAHGRARRDKDAANGIKPPTVERRPWSVKKGADAAKKIE